VEISKDALLKLLQDDDAMKIEIFWQRSVIEYKPYQRWLDYWKEG
jgi:hypothetical protein